jgi:hypothetical protein|tara:strand:+ start:385 stop:588 length:204 start_codon:yes stop_codon:yes gene_type:complete
MEQLELIFSKKENNIIVPTFDDWYYWNSKGYLDRQEEPYTREEGYLIYKELKRTNFRFPFWNQGEGL